MNNNRKSNNGRPAIFNDYIIAFMKEIIEHGIETGNAYTYAETSAVRGG